MRRLALMCWGLLLLVPAIAHAQTDPNRVAFNENLTIEKGQVVNGDVSVTNGNLTVYGEILGDAVVVGGSANVQGKIHGDLAVTNGNANLGAGSVVDGDVLAVMGKVAQDPKARVGGKVSVTSLDSLNNDAMRPPGMPGQSYVVQGVPIVSLFGSNGPFERFISFFAKGMAGLIMLVLGALMTVLLHSRVRVASATLESEPGHSGIVGLIVALLLLPSVTAATFLLAKLVIGIPFIPVLFVIVGLALLFGLVSVSARLGRQIYETTHHAHPASAHAAPPLLLEVLLGMAIMLGAILLPSLVAPGPVTVVMLGLLYVVACVGIGSAILSRFGTLLPPGHRYSSAMANGPQPTPPGLPTSTLSGPPPSIPTS